MTDLAALIIADWQAYRAALELDPDHWWLRRRELPDGRVLHLQKLPRFYRVSVSPSDLPVFDHVYDFDADVTAWRAILDWNGVGDPEGWYLHVQSGRRRPGGDPAQEYVDPTC